MGKYRTLPKIELHLHLDCSLSFEFVKKWNPNISKEAYESSFIAPAKCIDLADYLKRAEIALELMQEPGQLHEAMQDLFKQLHAENVIYAEIRLAPMQHLKKGLNPNEVVTVLCEALDYYKKKYDIPAGLILCTLRHFSEDLSLQTAHLTQEFKNRGVVGLDIAADEAGYPLTNHIKAFEFACKNNINRTAHAGEACGSQSVWETLNKLKPSRIGHGVRSFEDDKLIEFLKNNQIHLEVCPTSNIQTNVFDQISNHEVDALYKKGVSIGLNTDCRTISNVSLTQEYDIMEKIFGWQVSDFLKCNLNALEAAFAAPEVKYRLENLLNQAYQEI